MPVAVEDGLLRRAADGDDIEVKLGGKAAVEAQFFLAIEAAFLQRAEIEKAEIDGFLDLVGVVSGEQNPGDMGFDQFDVLDRMIVARWIRAVP